ncbi:hypothetical protein DL768_003871 [Monosporascus sp. mg162]|nr:hypothetical protein DL768_003871 [Monosporascus sp. mg162]
MTQTAAARSPVSKLSRANMRSELTTFSEFYNRYYTSSYGKQASDWLLGEFRSVVSASGATRASVKVFTRSWAQNSILGAILERSPSEVVVVDTHLDSVNDRNRVRLSSSKITAGQGVNTLEFHWYAGEEAGLLGSGEIFDSYRPSSAVVKAIAAAGHDGMRQQPNGRHHGLYGLGPRGATMLTRVGLQYTTTGYIHTQCGYGCSDHVSAFVIEAAMSRMSPHIHTDWDAASTLNFSHMLEHAMPAVGYAYELTLASIWEKSARPGGWVV